MTSMAKATEQKLVLTVPDGAKIIKTEIKTSKDGKSIEVSIITEAIQEEKLVEVNIDNFDELFPIINPSELVGHRLLTYKPKSQWQKKLMENIRRGIDLKLPAFRVSCMDPSEEDGKIVFKAGNNPAVGHSPVWWKEAWEKFMPSKNSRSGSELHWAAFLGKHMKYLVEEKNFSVDDAWRAVCDDSCGLGHYWNSKDAKHDFEATGSRQVGLFCDLANTYKILEKWESPEFLLVSSYYINYSYEYPLANQSNISNPNNNRLNSVGWIVMDV